MEKEKILNRKRHHDRDDLVGEHTFGDFGQALLLIIFLFVWISDSFFLHYSIITAKLVPLVVRIPVAAVILIISGLLAWHGMKIVFGEVREQAVVIQKGVFNYVRHPIYLAAILFYPGLILLTLSVAATIIWLIIIAFYHFIARHEEKLLLEKFGRVYEDYMHRVPMWIPRLKQMYY